MHFNMINFPITKKFLNRIHINVNINDTVYLLIEYDLLVNNSDTILPNLIKVLPSPSTIIVLSSWQRDHLCSFTVIPSDSTSVAHQGSPFRLKFVMLICAQLVYVLFKYLNGKWHISPP